MREASRFLYLRRRLPPFEIRPRRATELVDASFQLLRRFYAPLVSVSAVAMFPSIVVRIIERREMGNPAAMATNPWPWAMVGFIGLLSFIIADTVLVVAISDGYLEGEVDLARAFSAGLRGLVAVLWASFIRYLIVFALVMVIGVLFPIAVVAKVQFLLILLVPFALWLFFYLLLRTFAVTPAVMLEHAGANAAVGRSFRLSKHCTAHIFFSLGLAFVLYMVISIIVSTLSVTMLTPSTAAIVGAVVIIPVYPLFSVVSTLLYYDLRIRKEGFDLEIMSRELGGEPAPLPAA